MRNIATSLVGCISLLTLIGNCTSQEKAPNRSPIQVQLQAGEPNSKLAPRYSPKGRQFKLVPSSRTGLEGIAPIETRLQLGSTSGEGILAILTRPAADKPYDQLYLDENNDGELKEPVIKCEPKIVRGSTWSSFDGKVLVNQAASGKPTDLLPFPISLWIVVEDPAGIPDMIRISRRGFLTGEIKHGEATMQLVVSDSDNDGVIKKGDWWELRSTPPSKTAGMREIGDFQWGGGSAWKLNLDASDWRKATLAPHDPEMTEEEDANIRDHLREDRLAAKAATPVPFRKDIDEAITEASKAKSRCFIKFETEWCGPCKTMAELVFTAKDVAESAKGIVCVVVDGDVRKDLAEKHAVKGYPTGILLDGEGKEIARYVGYQSVKQTAAFLKQSKDAAE